MVYRCLAGIYMGPYRKTSDGFESQMAVNYLGHFLLTHLLMPQLIAGSTDNDGKNVRVVNVSSCAHEAGTLNYGDFNYERYYNAGITYADSKLAQVMFTRQLQKICDDKGFKIQIHAAHPGLDKILPLIILEYFFLSLHLQASSIRKSFRTRFGAR
jgi:NAD(P)-dependent dehydrogenase (short-subunit alcohol dehydrogenase family)